jgi:hypothetical protein
MDLSLLIFSLETYRFCMKCIEFTTRTYNFKNLAVGSLIWAQKPGLSRHIFLQAVGRARFCVAYWRSRQAASRLDINRYFNLYIKINIYLRRQIALSRASPSDGGALGPQTGRPQSTFFTAI